MLVTLTSLETFDTLAGRARHPEAVTLMVQRLARAALDITRIARD